MGGVKDSGFGRRHGAHGLLKYTESQTVAAQRLVPLSTPPLSFGQRKADVMSTALKVLARIPGIRWPRAPAAA